MKKCLCCGKELTQDNRNSIYQWHDRCVKRFFNTVILPQIEMSANEFKNLAEKTVGNGRTVTGVQKKLSVHLSKIENDNHRFTFVDYPSGYILKPQSAELPELPEAEFLVMKMAEEAGISVVPNALVLLNGEYAYITKRIDRKQFRDRIESIAMEDFAQLDNRLTMDKYRGSYEQCSKVIRKYSSQEGIDITELYIRVIFSYLIGNSDMHLKNFSLIEKEEGSYTLSEAYDFLCVNAVFPDDSEELALTLNGKKKNIHKKDVYAFAEKCGITKNVAEKLLNRLLAKKERFVEMCDESYLSDNLKKRLKKIINDRYENLSK